MQKNLLTVGAGVVVNKLLLNKEYAKECLQ